MLVILSPPAVGQAQRRTSVVDLDRLRRFFAASRFERDSTQNDKAPTFKLIRDAGRGLVQKSTTVASARKYVVSGRVQGVGFRFFAERVGNELGLRGYVKNLWNGDVEAYAIGEEAQLEEFKRRLAEGPRMARVTSVVESEAPLDKTYSRFLIE